MNINSTTKTGHPELYAWAFSFACAIGWAAFVMPATTFLPQGGVNGSILAFLLGGAAMCVIALCYHYLGNAFPEHGGIYNMIRDSMNQDVAFLAAWGMGLAHICCIPLNAKAMAMLVRTLLEELFHIDYHVMFFGSDVLLIEAVFIILVLCLFGAVLTRGIRQTARLQTAGAIVLLGGIVIMLIAAALTTPNHGAAFTPSEPENVTPFNAFMAIFLITPWAFVGFDSVSKVTQELGLPLKKIARVMIISVACGTFAYIANILTALLGMPAEYSSWPEYLESLKGLPGIEGYPVALAARRAMGHVGTAVFFIACISATLTGLVGFFTSVSRLLYQMAEDNMLPSALAKIDETHGTPKNAIWTVVVLALLMSLLRESFDFIEEVSSVGTSLGFGLIALSTMLNARKRGEKKFFWIGLLGTVLCALFLVFLFIHTDGINHVLSFKSYYLMMIWVFLGICFYSFYTRDRNKSGFIIETKNTEE